MKAMILALTASLALAGGATSAQTARPMLTYDTAAAIRDGCLAFAEDKDFAVAIAVFDDAGRLLAFAHMDTVPAAIGEVAQWKGKSAATYGIASAETGSWGATNAPLLADWGGGTPFFTADGVLLGGVGVSGAITEDDIACGLAGIAAAGLEAPDEPAPEDEAGDE